MKLRQNKEISSKQYLICNNNIVLNIYIFGCIYQIII